MQIVSTDEVKNENHKNIIMKILFENMGIESQVTFGTVQIPPGVRVPEVGFGIHDGDEYSIILNGSVMTESGGEKHRISKGQATFIPANEEHWSFNDGNDTCEIIWAIVKR